MDDRQFVDYFNRLSKSKQEELLLNSLKLKYQKKKEEYDNKSRIGKLWFIISGYAKYYWSKFFDKVHYENINLLLSNNNIH